MANPTPIIEQKCEQGRNRWVGGAANPRGVARHSQSRPVFDAGEHDDLGSEEKGNWIKTVPGKGWFPIFRFYSPSEPYFDKSWVLNDIEKTHSRSASGTKRTKARERCERWTTYFSACRIA